MSVQRLPREGLVLGVMYWLSSVLGCSEAGWECAVDACLFAGDSVGCAESESEKMGEGESSWPTRRHWRCGADAAWYGCAQGACACAPAYPGPWRA